MAAADRGEVAFLALRFLETLAPESFDAVRREVEAQHVLPGASMGVDGQPTGSGSGDFARARAALMHVTPDTLLRHLEALMRRSFEAIPPSARVATPVWTLLGAGADSVSHTVPMSVYTGVVPAAPSSGRTLRASPADPQVNAPCALWLSSARLSPHRCLLLPRAQRAAAGSAALAPRVSVCAQLRARELSAHPVRPAASVYASRLALGATTQGHLLETYCVLFDRSGLLLFTGSDDRLIKVWCARTASLVRTLRGHEGDITDLAVRQDNVLLASASNDSSVRLWRIADGAPVRTLVRGVSPINAIHFGPRAAPYWLAVGSAGSQAYAFDTRSLDAPPARFELPAAAYAPLADAHGAPTGGASVGAAARAGARDVVSVLIDARAESLIVSATDGSVHAWPLRATGGAAAAGAQLAAPSERGIALRGHTSWVGHLALSRSSVRLLTCSRDGTARVWAWQPRWPSAKAAARGGGADDSLGVRCELVLAVHHRAADAAGAAGTRATAGGGGRAAGAGAGVAAGGAAPAAARARERSAPRAVWVDMAQWSAADCLVVTSESERVRGECVSACIRVWCAQTGNVRHTVDTAAAPTYVLEPHPHDETLIACGGYGGRLLLVETPSARVIKTFGDAQWAPLLDGRFAPQGDRFALTDLEGRLSLIVHPREAEAMADTPPEQFFGSDYAPLVRDSLFNVLDARTHLPPHDMPNGPLLDQAGRVLAPHRQLRALRLPTAAVAQVGPGAQALVVAAAANDDGGYVALAPPVRALGHAAGGGVRFDDALAPPQPAQRQLHLDQPRAATDALPRAGRPAAPHRAPPAPARGAPSPARAARRPARAVAANSDFGTDEDRSVSLRARGGGVARGWGGPGANGERADEDDGGGSSSSESYVPQPRSPVRASAGVERGQRARARRARTAGSESDTESDSGSYESDELSDLESDMPRARARRVTRGVRRARGAVAGQAIGRLRRARGTEGAERARSARRRRAVASSSESEGESEGEGDAGAGDAHAASDDERDAAPAPPSREPCDSAPSSDLNWLLRHTHRPGVYVPQEGDRVVYLREGHELHLARARALVAGRPSSPLALPPPFCTYPQMSLATPCVVVRVRHAPAHDQQLGDSPAATGGALTAPCVCHVELAVDADGCDGADSQLMLPSARALFAGARALHGQRFSVALSRTDLPDFLVLSRAFARSLVLAARAAAALDAAEPPARVRVCYTSDDGRSDEWFDAVTRCVRPGPSAWEAVQVGWLEPMVSRVSVAVSDGLGEPAPDAGDGAAARRTAALGASARGWSDLAWADGGGEEPSEAAVESAMAAEDNAAWLSPWELAFAPDADARAEADAEAQLAPLCVPTGAHAAAERAQLDAAAARVAHALELPALQPLASPPDRATDAGWWRAVCVPLDLRLIHRRLESGYYRALAPALADVEVLTRNAQLLRGYDVDGESVHAILSAALRGRDVATGRSWEQLRDALRAQPTGRPPRRSAASGAAVAAPAAPRVDAGPTGETHVRGVESDPAVAAMAACSDGAGAALSASAAPVADRTEAEAEAEAEAAENALLQAALHRLLEELSALDVNGFFQAPPRSLPGYDALISQPMDFRTVRSKLKRQNYAAISDLAADVQLVATNALRYNPPQSRAWASADGLLNAAMPVVSRAQDTFLRERLALRLRLGLGAERAPDSRGAACHPWAARGERPLLAAPLRARNVGSAPSKRPASLEPKQSARAVSASGRPARSRAREPDRVAPVDGRRTRAVAEGASHPAATRTAAPTALSPDARAPLEGRVVELSVPDGWRRGTVTRSNARTGVHTVVFDDGGSERAELVGALWRFAPRFRKGDTVSAQWGHDADELWFDAKVEVVRDDGGYDVRYEDGDVEMAKPESRVRERAPAAAAAAPASAEQRAARTARSPAASDGDGAKRRRVRR